MQIQIEMMWILMMDDLHVGIFPIMDDDDPMMDDDDPMMMMMDDLDWGISQ